MMYDTMRIVRSDGRTLNIEHGIGWRLKRGSYADWTDQAISIGSSPNVHTNGSTPTHIRLEEKDRTASAFFVGSDILAARDQAQTFFNYCYDFKVYFTHLGRTRWAEGKLKGFSCPPVKDFEGLAMTFTIRCFDPLFRDPDGNEEAFGDSVPYFGWPWVSFMRKPVTDGSNRPVGSTPSRKVFDGVNTIYNGGDVPSRYKIRIEAEGELQNPKIEKDGKKIQLVTTLYAGDVALVDFEGEETTVTINGEDAISVVSRDSSLLGMEMQVGANVFTFSVTNVENRSLAKVQILFHKKYLGV